MSDDIYFTTDLTGALWAINTRTREVKVSYDDAVSWHACPMFTLEDIEYFLSLPESALDHMRVLDN